MRGASISCPAWSELLEHRFDPSVEEPQGWLEAKGHLAGCDRCRLEVVEIDPSYLFETLEPIELGENEVQDMVHAVRTLRSSSVVRRTASGPDRHAGRFAEESAVVGWQRLTAASLAAAALLAVMVWTATRQPGPAQMAEAPTVAGVIAPPPSSGEATALVPMLALSRRAFENVNELPTIEGPLADDARVYRLDDDTFSVVMVVAETFEL